MLEAQERSAAGMVIAPLSTRRSGDLPVLIVA